MLSDALAPLRLIVTAGQVGDITPAFELLDRESGDVVLADKPMTAMPCARSSP